MCLTIFLVVSSVSREIRFKDILCRKPAGIYLMPVVLRAVRPVVIEVVEVPECRVMQN